MATTYTPNFNLGKQEDYLDKFDMGVITHNADIIDEELHKRSTDTENEEKYLGKTETAAAAALDGVGGNIAEQFADDKNTFGIVKTTLGTSCKNLLPVNCPTVTKNGVTLTPTEDGMININGVSTIATAVTAYSNLRTGATDISLQYDRFQLLPPGDYIVSGSGYPNVKIQICGMTSEETSSLRVIEYATVNDKKITVSDDYLYTWARLLLDNGVSQNYDNITIYPMIRRADVTDGTYEPYKPSLQTQIDDLAARLAALEAAATTTA